MQHVPKQVMFWAIKRVSIHLKGSKVYKVYFQNITESNWIWLGGMHMFGRDACLLSWLWWWFPRHIHVSKLIKLYILNVLFIICHFHCKKLFQKNMTSLNANLMRPFSCSKGCKDSQSYEIKVRHSSMASSSTLPCPTFYARCPLTHLPLIHTLLLFMPSLSAGTCSFPISFKTPHIF